MAIRVVAALSDGIRAVHHPAALDTQQLSAAIDIAVDVFRGSAFGVRHGRVVGPVLKTAAVDTIHETTGLHAAISVVADFAVALPTHRHTCERRGESSILVVVLNTVIRQPGILDEVQARQGIVEVAGPHAIGKIDVRHFGT